MENLSHQLMSRKRIRKSIANYNIIFDDIRKWFIKERYWLYYSISCLEHIQKLDKAISEMYRLLNPWINDAPFESISEKGHALGLWFTMATCSFKRKRIWRYLKEIHPFEFDIATDKIIE